MTDLPSRQRGRPKTNKHHKSHYIELKIWSWVPEGARHQDGLADWPSAVTWLWLWLYLWVYTASQLRRATQSSSPQWEPQTSPACNQQESVRIKLTTWNHFHATGFRCVWPTLLITLNYGPVWNRQFGHPTAKWRSWWKHFPPLKLVQLLEDYEGEHSALRKIFVGCVYRFCEFVRAGHLFHSYNSRYPIGTSTGITLL